MKIGIFGGTFDPMHNGHLRIITEASKKLDKVIIVPTICDYYRNPRKLFSFDERVRIITKMITSIPYDVTIDIIEKDKDSKWRFINTLEYFRKIYPTDELYVIIGEDSYKAFDTWFRYDDILNMSTLMVVKRGKNTNLVKTLPCELLDIGNDFLEASSTKIRDKLIEELTDMYLTDSEWYNK